MFTVEEEAKLEGSTVPQTIFGVCLSVCLYAKLHGVTSHKRAIFCSHCPRGITATE